MMTEAELIKLLKQKQLKIAFDTNVLFGLNRFYRICDQLNTLGQIELIVPVLAYIEKIYDLKQSLKQRYNHDLILEGFSSKQVKIMTFTQKHAEAVANLIWQQFPDKKDWKQFKSQRCVSCLGLTEIPATATKNKRCSATVDWLIAGYAVAENCLLVTDDKGVEFQGVLQKTSLDLLETCLAQF